LTRFFDLLKKTLYYYYGCMTSHAEKAGSRRAGEVTGPGGRFSGTRPTIGYLALRTGDNVSQVLWRGVVDAARERDANLICFAGDRLRDPDGVSSPANVLYDLVSSEAVDGLVSWASSVGGALERDEIVRFHRRYQPLPMEGCPTVLIDSYAGMRDVIAHCVSGTS
jgi:hypothetical protein